MGVTPSVNGCLSIYRDKQTRMDGLMDLSVNYKSITIKEQ